LKTSNLILDFEFDQHLESHKHVINIIMWFRDMGCYTYNNWLLLELKDHHFSSMRFDKVFISS
jgi:hypothetical protein